MKSSYFVEGLQGAGKTTLVQKLSDCLRDYEVFREGDYSPVELAWCAYVTEKQYGEILTRYPSLAAQIKAKTVKEGDHRIICYTQIPTDLPGFYQDMEAYEIYNGKLDKESFERLILERFGNWNGEKQIFECSVFQNIIENQMLYFTMTDGEILEFYGRLKRVLGDRPYRIIYLDVEDISGTIEIIRKERTDDKGNERWFSLMIHYIEESPYGKVHHLKGSKELIRHLEKRRALEHRIMEEVFQENSIILKAKKYRLSDVIAVDAHPFGGTSMPETVNQRPPAHSHPENPFDKNRQE